MWVLETENFTTVGNVLAPNTQKTWGGQVTTMRCAKTLGVCVLALNREDSMVANYPEMQRGGGVKKVYLVIFPSQHKSWGKPHKSEQFSRVGTYNLGKKVWILPTPPPRTPTSQSTSSTKKRNPDSSRSLRGRVGLSRGLHSLLAPRRPPTQWRPLHRFSRCSATLKGPAGLRGQKMSPTPCTLTFHKQDRRRKLGHAHVRGPRPHPS